MENIERIYEMLPEGWEEAAKREKAFQRGRNIKTPKELLRLILLYQTSGGSYGLTSAITQISEDQKGLNKTAVQKRIVNSGNWLKWMCEHLCQEKGYIAPIPKWLEQYRVCVVDASDYTTLGSHAVDFRLHYMMELFSLNTVELYFTDATQGETLKRYQNLQKNDLILADRVYGTIEGMNHVAKHGAYFLFRLKANGFNLYDDTGKRYDLTQMLQMQNCKTAFDLHLFYKNGKYLHPIRICILKKSAEDVKKSQRQLKKSNRSSRDLSELQLIWSQYVVVATSLGDDISPSKILELYRMRWQIELVFKRFKSIFGGGEFTVRKDDAVKAWFYGKFLIAILCEMLAKQSLFSPNEEFGEC